MRACARQGDIKAAEKCLRAMEAAGLTPGEKSYNKVLAACGRKGNLEEAQRFFSEMEERGVSPTAKTYTAVIHACTRAGKLEVATEWAKQMEHRGLEGDGVSYGAIIHAFAKEGRFQEAEFWLERAKQRGAQLSAFSYNGFMIACGRFDDTFDGLKWLGRMMQDGVPPDNYTFVSAALPLARQGQLRAVLEIRNRLFENGRAKIAGGVDMDTHAYNCVLLAIKVSRPIRLDIAEDVLLEMIQNEVEMDSHSQKHIHSIEKAARREGYLFSRLKQRHYFR